MQMSDFQGKTEPKCAFSLVKAVFSWFFFGFWGGFLGRVYFLLKKELICFRVLGIFADLLLLRRMG